MLTEQKIEVRDILSVIDKIRQHGSSVDGAYRLDGIEVIASYDEYTVTLKNDYVELNVFFHNKFKFTGTNKKEKLSFLDKLNKINKNY